MLLQRKRFPTLCCSGCHYNIGCGSVYLNLIPLCFSAPEIIEPLCKSFTSSIQIFSSSPLDVAAEQKISHFLLYRLPSQHRVWKCVSMYGRQEHRVFGLEPNSEYDFVILAYNLRGECQLSNKVSLQTEASASY